MRRRCDRRRSAGYTYLGLMFLVALMALVAAAAGSAWGFAGQRDKERELLFIGREYRRALEAYHRAHAGEPQPDPTSLRQLLGESAGPSGGNVRRYLRRLYADPMTGRDEWGLVRSPQGGIVGIYSLSTREPIRLRDGVGAEQLDFATARIYRDWVFMADARRSAPPGEPASGSEGEPPLRWEDFPQRRPEDGPVGSPVQPRAPAS